MRQPCVYKDLFLPYHHRLTPPSWGTPCNINAIYTSLKSTFSGLQFRCSQLGSIFIRLAVTAPETREMSRNSKRIWPYSSSRSSKVIDLGVNGKSIYDFLLVINVTLAVSATDRLVFEMFTLKEWKTADFTYPPLFDAPTPGEPLRISGRNLPRKKTREMGLPYSENFIILTSTVFSRP